MSTSVGEVLRVVVEETGCPGPPVVETVDCRAVHMSVLQLDAETS
jgi:hypothetical protein